MTSATQAALPNRADLCSLCMRSVIQTARKHLPQLTERQRQCLQGFLERKTAKEIGRELGIGHHGVEQHLKAARKKLGAKSTAEAARLYFGGADTMDEPYYASSELSDGPFCGPFVSEPEAGR